MKRILIDMDDVLADASGQFANYFSERIRPITKESLHSIDWTVSVGPDGEKVKSWVYEPGFFRTMPVMPDAQEVVKKLLEKYEIFIVSAAIEFPNSLKEKVEWMAEHFPFIDWHNIVLCGHKWMIDADYLIDDHFKNLRTFRKTALVFDAPHNRTSDEFHRLHSWKDAEAYFL